ncbi:MAG TPA: LuxR C-terminal-related transcriptional regulator [Trebonia sp.]
MTALTLGRRRDNLPADVTRFIGRKRELAAVTDAVSQHRLVTLRGVGGVGKTRLALRAAAAERESFADGCWLVELSAVHDPGLLPRTISGTLRLPGQTTDGDPLTTLAGHLSDRELLLVLDTCEHLVDACAELARVLLAAAPGLQILATSREPLGVPDENVLLIAPLEVTAEPGGGESDAVALFVDRAQAAMEGFRLTPENSGGVTDLCRKLDGIPLALELAAVRLRSMPVEEILARLDNRFGILGTTRTNTGRHRTLRSAVRWSYELCTPAGQRLWADLSVFPGSFDLAAAEHLCGPAALDDLLRLVEKSVVQYDERAGRYRMLDTMREFGAEQLAERADADELRARHLDHYLDLVVRAAAATVGPGQADWMQRLQEEAHNLRDALGWSLRTPGQEAAGLRMTVGLRTFWLMAGKFSNGRTWHEKARQVCHGTSDHAWAVYGAAILAVQQGDLPTAGPLLDQAAGLAADLGDEDLAAHVCDARGIAAFYIGDLETAYARHEAAIAWYEKHGFSEAFALSSYGRLASVCLLLFDIDRAIELCEEWLRRCERTGEQWGRGSALWVRGAGRWLAQDLDGAVADALACLEIKEALGDLHTITMSFDLLAVCYTGLGDYERAAVLYGAGDKYWKLLGAPIQMGPGYSNIRRSAGDTAREQLGEEAYGTAYARGTGLRLAEVMAVARGERPAVPEQHVPVRPLTPREKEIAALVAEGLGNREIAERLVLSKRTVDSHMEHIFTKLGFSSRTQVATWVLENASK